VVGHVSPEAAVGGPIALLEEGDEIYIDAATGQISVDLSQDDLARRRSRWVRPPSDVSKGLLAKYRSEVSSASLGAVTVARDWEI